MRTRAIASILALLGAPACGAEAPRALDPVAGTLRGLIRLLPIPLIPGAEPPGLAQLGGDLDLVLYRTSAEGYCLQLPQSIGFTRRAVLAAPDVAALAAAGLPYELPILEAPGQTYPMTLFPVAQLRNTAAAGQPCEKGPPGSPDRYSALGFHGLASPADLFQALSPCCLARPRALVISEAGQVIEGVDFVLYPAPRLAPSCAPAGAPFDICSLRHAPPPNQDQDSLCYQSLGASAVDVLRRPSGELCP